jgi:4-amino-4-deoxy-L-arabinose transferase-like glycosyltransferase
MTTSGPARHVDFMGPGGPGGPGRPGGPGAQADNPALAELVQGLDNRWAAASVGSFTVSSLELKTGASIMAIGGFTGGDDSPTLAQFQDYVKNHDVRYFIAGERFGPPGNRRGTAGEITQWVQKNFTPMKVGEATVYDLQK